jgi:hypothetical protein
MTDNGKLSFFDFLLGETQPSTRVAPFAESASKPTGSSIIRCLRLQIGNGAKPVFTSLDDLLSSAHILLQTRS